MIKGFGTDIVDIGRIKRLVDKYDAHFKEKVFTKSEIDYCEKKVNPAIHFSGRWAAKEAFYKALPNICQKHSTWKSIEIINTQDYGKPILQICSKPLMQVLKKEQITFFYVSISHEQKYCVASVILE